MANDKRIEIEIAAHTTGEPDIQRLLKLLRDSGQDVAPFEAAAKRLAVEMDKLKSQQALIDQFTRLKKSSGDAATALEQAQEKAQALGKAFAQTAEPTKSQTAELDRAKKAVHDAKQAYEEITGALQTTRSKMQEVGIDSKNLAQHQRDVDAAVKQTAKELGELKTGCETAATANKKLAESEKAMADAMALASSEAKQKAEAGKQALAAEQSEINLQRQRLNLDKETQQSVLRLAQARGDEAKATQASNQLREIEVQKLQLLAQEKRAEATAIATSTAAKRAELAAIGPLTQAQILELQASENLAKSLRVQATTSETAAQNMRALGQASDKAKAPMEEVGKSVEKMGAALDAAKEKSASLLDGMKLKATAVATAIATYFGVNAFMGAVRGAADFETAMSRIKSATNASAEEMAAFKAAAENAGATSKYSATEAAGALEELAKAGLNSKEAIAALPAAMNLAQAGDVSLAQASAHLTSAVFGMGLQFSETGRVADVLAKAANESKTNVNGLADAFSKAAPISRQLGVGIEGLAAMVGQFVSAGVGANEVGTALTSVMVQFSDPASKFQQELAALGITTTDFEKALHQLAATGSSGEKAIRAVGDSGPILQAGLSRGMPALDALKTSLMGAEGAAAAAAKEMDDNLNGALGKLSSAWKTVTVALGTPVLPVLKSGVDELAAAINAAVTNGTITRFGEALATAFQSAITWVRAFAAETDFKKTAADLQAFATRAGEVFDQIGQYATNAGNIVKLVYGVMSSGTNAVLAAVYGIGEAFAGVASNIQSGLALLYEGIAKITFGEVSKAYAQAAAEMKLSAKATWEASEKLGQKAKESFIAMGDGAQTARDGFVGLSEQSQKLGTAAAGIAPAAKAATDAIDALRESAIQEGDAWLAAAEQLEAAKKATDEKAESDKAARKAIEGMREEYRALISSRDLDGAGKKLGEIEKALAGIGNEAKKSPEEVKKAAKEIEKAYIGLGVTSDTALKNIAEAARVNYELLKKSGVASARELSAAFAFYAEKAIAANNGVASTAIKTEAAMRGYKVEVDDTGKASLKLVTATDGLAASFAKAGEAIKAKAAAAKAESDLMISGLELRRSELSSSIAIAKAHGDEEKVTKLTIEQKRIEIQIIQAMVKAQIAEAEAIIAVAEAKKSELAASGNLTPEKRAELDATIKAGQAKINEAKARGESVRVIEDEIKELQKSSNAQRDNASSINQTTSALEKLNREKEREIAAQEKANELKQREIDLYNKKWNMDAEHNTLGPDGKKLEATVETQKSLYNKAVDAGLDPLRAKALADEIIRTKDKYGNTNMNLFWEKLNQIKQDAQIQAALDAEKNKKEDERKQRQAEQNQRNQDAAAECAAAQKPPAAPASPSFIPQKSPAAPAPSSPITQKIDAATVVNLHYNGQSVGRVHTDPAGADALDAFMSQLEMGKSNWPT
jgi:TP901 family phage tail tape measure protein